MSGRFLNRQKKRITKSGEMGRTVEKGKEVRTENRPDDTNIKRKLKTRRRSTLGIIL